MEALCLLDDLSSMNESNDIHESLQLALKRIDDAESQEVSDWEGLFPGKNKTKSLLSGGGDGSGKAATDAMQRVAFLNDQILRSATRMMHTENEIQTIHSESGANMKKLQGIESEISHQKAMLQQIQCETSEEEKQALVVFRDAMMKARLEYNRVKKLQKGKRNAKVQLIAAAQERLDTLRVSHEELSRVYAQKSIDLEQKLKKEKLFYTLNLDSLAEAQQKVEEEEALLGEETSSTAGSTSDESLLQEGPPLSCRPMSPVSGTTSTGFRHRPTSPRTTSALSRIRSSTSESVASGGRGGKDSSLTILNVAPPPAKPESSSTLSDEGSNSNKNDLSMFQPTMSPIAYKFRPTSPTSVSSGSKMMMTDPAAVRGVSKSSTPTSPSPVNQEDEALLKYLQSW